ncbi:MAG: hypothetical protein IKD20_02320 [Clostridia bacterium]|nr:hypothetical protein [Clostridia bacterium]
MKGIIDKIVLYITVSVLCLSWLWYLKINISLALSISLIVGLVVCMVVYRGEGKIPLSRYIDYLRTLDERELYEHIARYIHPSYEAKVQDSHLSLNDGSVLVAQIGYSTPSKDYMASLYRRYKGAERIYLFTPHDTKGLLAYSKAKVIPLHPRTLLKKLVKLGFTLPTTPKKKVDLSTIFQRSRAKYYLFSGVVLMLNIFLYTPYRLYYVITSSLLLTMALFCLFSKPTKKQINLFE